MATNLTFQYFLVEKKKIIYYSHSIIFEMEEIMKKVTLVLIVLSLVLLNFNCKTNNESDLIDQQKVEKIVGLTTSMVNSLVSAVYHGSISLGNGNDSRY